MADALAQRHPEIYEALGRPRPGCLHSARRNQSAQLLAKRGFRELDDPSLAAEFEIHLRWGTRTLAFLLSR